MKLLLRRSQRNAGMMGGKIVFGLDARIDLATEEAELIKKYGLGKTIVYNSENSQKNAQAALANLDSGSASGLAKGLFRMGLSAASLRCTIDSLSEGQHIECKDLDELLGAEAAIVQACNNTKEYIQVASTFDGSEQVIDI